MFKRNVIISLSILLLASSLVGCGKQNDTIDLSSNNLIKEKNDKDKAIPLQTSEQKAINTIEAHFDYVVSHQAKLNSLIQDLKETVIIPDENEKQVSMMTNEVREKIKELYEVGQEYETYYNKVKPTKEADDYYKLAMKSFKDFVKECEQDIELGSYEKEDSGIDSLLDMMELTMKTYEAFDRVKSTS